MDEVAAYLKGKIERAASDYKKAASRLTPADLARVERLAKRTKDPALANYFRSTMQPDQIASAVDDIFRHLEAGQIVEADIVFETLKANVALVESCLNRPIFQTGAKQRQYLDSARAKANAARKHEADRQHREWIAEAQSFWTRNSRRSVVDCADKVIKKLKISAKPKTVEDVIRNFHPKKVGGAG